MKPPRRNPRHQTPAPEEIYAELIALGMVRIERRRNKPPLVIWTRPAPAK